MGTPDDHPRVPGPCPAGSAAGFATPAASKPSPPLTAQQQDRLKERDQLAMQAEQLRSLGKLPEAIKAAEAMRSIEREVLGETSEDAIGSLELLVQLHQDREDWAAARKAGKEVLNLRSATLPKDHWQVADARWALDNIDTVAKLSDRDRRGSGRPIGSFSRLRNCIAGKVQRSDGTRARRGEFARHCWGTAIPTWPRA